MQNGISIQDRVLDGFNFPWPKHDKPMIFFHSNSNEEISAELTALWGIGRWTVEMFLMFHLGRLDLWPVGDLAMRRGWEKLHALDYEIEPKKLDLIGEKFSGRQSIVAWYCWRATEGDSSSW